MIKTKILLYDQDFVSNLTKLRKQSTFKCVITLFVTLVFSVICMFIYTPNLHSLLLTISVPIYLLGGWFVIFQLIETIIPTIRMMKVKTILDHKMPQSVVCEIINIASTTSTYLSVLVHKVLCRVGSKDIVLFVLDNAISINDFVGKKVQLEYSDSIITSVEEVGLI